MSPSERRRAGFTLVELLVAVTIFAMVMAGLSVIYSSIFRQGTGILSETRMRNMSTLTMRAIQQELAQATTIQLPVACNLGDPACVPYGKHLRGWTNVSPDMKLNNSGPEQLNLSGNDKDRHWFHFCVQTQTGHGCGGDKEPPLNCLFYYRGKPASDWVTNPPIGDNNCGDDLPDPPDQWEKQLMASGLSLMPNTGGQINGPLGYFSRDVATDKVAPGQIRVGFRIQQPATMDQKTRTIRTDSDTTFSVSMPAWQK